MIRLFSLISFFLLSTLLASENELVFIDVGQGNATLINFVGAPPMIVDSGSSELRGADRTEKSEFKRNTICSIRSNVERFLPTHHVAPIDLNVVISHAHSDHHNLIPDIFNNEWMKNRKVRFLLGGWPEDYQRTEPSKNLLKVVARYCMDDRFTSEFQGKDIPPFDCGSGRCDVVARPLPAQEDSDLNGRSIVLRIKSGNIEGMLTGDAIGSVTSQILLDFNKKEHELVTSIYQACHHGSKDYGSNDEKFINAVKPNYVVFSSGTRYKHPSSVVVSRVIPHVCIQPNVFHILSYHPNDNGEVKDMEGDKIILKKKVKANGYVVSLTNMQIFNTQNQKTIVFKPHSIQSGYDVCHSGKKDTLDKFEDSDF